MLYYSTVSADDLSLNRPLLLDKHDETFGWPEALKASTAPRQPSRHTPFLGCPCDVCVATRKRVEELGFDAEGEIRVRRSLPWEAAA